MGTAPNGHEKNEILPMQLYQSIGHHKIMKKYKNTYGETLLLP